MREDWQSHHASARHAYRWQGRNASGERVSGTLNAADRHVALATLMQQGMTVSRLRRERPPAGARLTAVRSADISGFVRQLATLQQAGVPLSRSLMVVADSQVKPAMKHMIGALDAVVREGGPLSEALAAHPGRFPPLICHLVAAGESAGRLDELLGRIADHLERLESIKAGVRSALVYPALVCAVALIVSALLLWWVVPAFAALFEDFDAQLPALTRAVMGASDWLHAHGSLAIAAAATLAGAAWLVLRRAPEAVTWALKAALRLPVLGPILRLSALARFSQTLGMLFSAGVPLLEAMDPVAAATGHPVYQQAVLRLRDGIAEGLSLQAAMRAQGVFPETMLQMIAVGEESGRLEDLLQRIATAQALEVDQRVQRLAAAMEPLIMAVLGCLVGTLMLALYLPVFHMGNVF
jgi:type IV pilus assembly protein PilC